MPVTSSRIDAERGGARTAAQDMHGLRDEVTVLAEQMAALGSAVGPDTWCGASADAFRGHVNELGGNAGSLARGYDEVAVALGGHAQALDALYDVVLDAEQRRDQGERDRTRAQADLRAAEQAVDRAHSALQAAQQQSSSAAADPTGAAQAGASSAMAAAQAALAAANRDRAQAQSALETAERAIRRAQDDLDDADREHRRIGERCADDVLDARDLPFHTHAWDFVSSSIRGMGGPDWTDFLSGVVMMPAVAAKEMLGKADRLGATAKDLKPMTARGQGSPVERAAVQKQRKAALRERTTLRRDVGKLPWQPPPWLRKVNKPLGNLWAPLNKVPGAKLLPGASVGLAAASTVTDVTQEDMGVGHAIVKNGASLGAGAGVSYGIVAGAAAVGMVGLAPVVVGVLVGGVVAAGVGHAVKEHGDDVAEAAGDALDSAGDALDSAGDALGDAKDGIQGIFS